VCMCVVCVCCVWVCMYVYVCVYVCHVCVCVLCVCVVWGYACMCMYVCMYVCMCACVCVLVFVCMAYEGSVFVGYHQYIHTQMQYMYRPENVFSLFSSMLTIVTENYINPILKM